MRIAYVEDNPTNLSLVERVAKMTQHTITNYDEGEIALEALKREPYDLILMDIELAGALSGLDVVATLREYGLKTPIIAVTAYAMLGDKEKFLQVGCNDYLPKPLPIPDFINMLKKYEGILASTEKSPLVDAPKAEAPKADAPKVDAPKVVDQVAPAPNTGHISTVPVDKVNLPDKVEKVDNSVVETANSTEPTSSVKPSVQSVGSVEKIEKV